MSVDVKVQFTTTTTTTTHPSIHPIDQHTLDVENMHRIVLHHKISKVTKTYSIFSQAGPIKLH
jgi:hypothetical protein